MNRRLRRSRAVDLIVVESTERLGAGHLCRDGRTGRRSDHQVRVGHVDTRVRQSRENPGLPGDTRDTATTEHEGFRVLVHHRSPIRATALAPRATRAQPGFGFVNPFLYGFSGFCNPVCALVLDSGQLPWQAVRVHRRRTPATAFRSEAGRQPKESATARHNGGHPGRRSAEDGPARLPPSLYGGFAEIRAGRLTSERAAGHITAGAGRLHLAGKAGAGDRRGRVTPAGPAKESRARTGRRPWTPEPRGGDVRRGAARVVDGLRPLGAGAPVR